MNVYKYNTTALAYIGDAAYELSVRRHVFEIDQVHVDQIHKETIKFVRAEGQARALKAIFPELSPEEQALVKRARNRKITSMPRNADPVEYKLATAFEALLGYHFLEGNGERLEELTNRAMTYISGNPGAK